MMEMLSTRQVAARIRHGKLPDFCKGGEPRCACHPNMPSGTQTESLRIWSKGDLIGCTVDRKPAPALAVFAPLGITIDTRL